MLKNLLIGDAYTGLKKVLFGYEKEDDGSHVEGILDLSAPLAVNYLLMPDVAPEVCAIADYCAAYPWKHGEDLLCFEVMLPGTQEEYDAYIADIEAKDSFVKTTREEKVGRKTIHYTTYTIEDKAYVGDIVIEVSEYFVIDTTLPTISSINSYEKDGEARIRINIDDYKIATAVVGYGNENVYYDEETKQYYLDLSKEDLEASLKDLGDVTAELSGARPRLYLELTDSAYGVNKMIIHFNGDNYNEYEIVQGDALDVTYDFKYNEDTNSLEWVAISYDGEVTPIDELEGVSYISNYKKATNKDGNGTGEDGSKGCCASVASSSALILIMTTLGIALLLKKRKALGGNK